MEQVNLVQQILEDFREIIPCVAGLYLYGSQAGGMADHRSDIDICLVAGSGSDPESLQFLAWRKVRSGKYDIRVFELLPLHLQMRILAGGILLSTYDNAALGEYLYQYWKRWDDQRWYQTPVPGAP